MKANIKNAKNTSITSSHRKDNYCHTSYKVIDTDFNTLVDCRVYFNPKADGSSNVYCCLWVNNRAKNIHFSGSGKADGYGYCKTSACVQAALDHCGVELSKDIAGVGEQAIETALLAVGRAVSGKRKLGYIVSNA